MTAGLMDSGLNGEGPLVRLSPGLRSGTRSGEKRRAPYTRRMKLDVRYRLPLGVMALFGAGLALSHLSDDAGFIRWLGMLCIFFFWVWGICCWGGLLVKWLGMARPGGGLCLAVGAALVSVATGVAGSAGILGSFCTVILPVSLCLGMVLSARFQAAPALHRWPGLRRLLAKQYGLLLVGLFLVFRGVQASMPDMHPDALWYNLPAAFKWVARGAIRFDPHGISMVNASFWDYLYIWPQAIFGGGSMAAMISAHVFSQWIHFAGGYLAVLLLLVALFGREGVGVSNRNYFHIALLAALTAQDPFFAAVTAKNDWGVAAWFLAGVLLVRQHEAPRARLLGYFLLGLSCAAKMPYVYPVGIFLFVHLLVSRKNRVSFGRLAARMAILALPFMALLARNAAWTGNPFFPTWGDWFPSPYLTEVWRRGIAAFQGGTFSLDAGLAMDLMGFFPPTQLVALLFFLPLIKPGQRVYGETFRVLAHTALWSALAFSLFTGPLSAARLIGIIPVIIIFQGTLVTCRILEKGFPGRRSAVVFCLLLSAYLLYAPRAWYGGFGDVVQGRKAGEIVQRAQSGASLRYLLAHPAPGMRVVLLNETRLYYFLPFGGIRVWDDPELDRRLRGCRDASEMVAVLVEAGGTHLVLTAVNIDGFFHEATGLQLLELASRHAEATLVLTSGERLVDLNRLLRAVTEDPRP